MATGRVFAFVYRDGRVDPGAVYVKVNHPDTDIIHNLAEALATKVQVSPNDVLLWKVSVRNALLQASSPHVFTLDFSVVSSRVNLCTSVPVAEQISFVVLSNTMVISASFASLSGTASGPSARSLTFSS